MTGIDAHQHFWWHAKRAHTWPPLAGDRLDRDFTPDDLTPELKRAGIDGTVLIQSLNDLDETQEYLDLANEHSFVRGVVGWVPLDRPADIEGTVARLRQRGKLVGFRHLTRVDTSPDWMLQPDVLRSLAVVAREGLTFDTVPIDAAQFENVLALAAKLPDLTIIIDHLGRPPIPEQGWEPWATLIGRAAAHPNVAIKLSTGMDVVMRWRWKTDMLPRYVDHVAASFGARRVMAASNWPVILLAGSYQEAWGGITTLISGLSDSERADILGGTATRVYGLSSSLT